MFTKNHPKSKRSLRRMVAKKTREAELLLTFNSSFEESASNSPYLSSSQPSSSNNINLGEDLSLFEVSPTIYCARSEPEPKRPMQSQLTTLNTDLALDINEVINKAPGHPELSYKQAHFDLRKWAVCNKIPHCVLNGLLKGVLCKNFPQARFPSDARTLLETSKKLFNINLSQNYCYFGIEKSINYLFRAYNVEIAEGDAIELGINVDGLPLTKSTDSSFWPVLGSIKSLKILKNIVFLIALYYGKAKPKHPDILMSDFVKECQRLNGKITIQNIEIDFTISMIICDMPAKSFLLQIKGPTGYFSCTHCLIEGEAERYVCFPQVDCPKRTDGSFRQKINKEHHIGTSLVENIPNFNLIVNVPLDYMHLVCLGVVKRLLTHKKYGFVFGKPPYKLRASSVIRINERLKKMRRFIPIEFGRKTRPITESRRYKASELRTFLIYTGPVVLKNVLQKKNYNNFVVLSVAISILLSEHAFDVSWLKYAEELITCFIDKSKSIYDIGFFSLNVHSLSHLVDCCKKFGPLDSFSAFPYENYMQKLLRYVRKAHQPLQQVIRRVSEENNLLNSLTINTKKCVKPSSLNCVQVHSEGPLAPGCKGPQYKKMVCDSFTISCNTFGNRFVMLKDGSIFEVKNICYDNSNKLSIVGQPYKKVGDLFNKPCHSSLLNIWVIKKQESPLLMFVSASDINSKLLILPFNEVDDNFVTFPIIHCIKA
ncbi:uncharacterized protein LOC115884507 isoform X1 [Sitophilus oryzae]|uniref:Uncharacterized protein LOC115884507 isoform X1 n=1 Tax=Sitophilus oryzae TaxID=7048 RepID=A0A6J2Y7A0_SITOR|nr:uncharacterized protein LOC115884507 isoform X1 [Sitophilus oryzae]